MATDSYQEIIQSKVIGDRDSSIEALQVILSREGREPVSYEEAESLGHELMTFFGVFSDAGERESGGDDSS